MNDKDKYAPTGETMKRIANTVRYVETGGKLPEGGLKKRHRLIPHEEGVLLEDLPGTADPNVPTRARFQIKSPHRNDNGWSDDVAPSIVTVMNRTPTDFEAGTVGFAKELQTDKWYFYTNSGGGGARVIWFTIDQVLCPDVDYVAETTLVITPFWYSHGCEGDPPGADEYGVYHVYDICSYMNGLTAEELPNTVGRATWMYPLNGYGYCEPRWLLDDLCAQPECTDPEE